MSSPVLTLTLSPSLSIPASPPLSLSPLSLPASAYLPPQVFNLSERSYDISRFNNQVLDFGWPDHLAPSLERLSRYTIQCTMYTRHSLRLCYACCIRMYWSSRAGPQSWSAFAQVCLCRHWGGKTVCMACTCIIHINLELLVEVYCIVSY